MGRVLVRWHSELRLCSAYILSHKKLFIPGPTEAIPEVLGQQTQWLIGHRSKDYTALYTGIIDKLHQYFETQQHATVLTASGTIWMDITARNMVRKKALAGVCGAFSQRMANTIRDSGKEVTPLEVEWGKAIKPEMILEELAKDAIKQELTQFFRFHSHSMSPPARGRSSLLVS